LLLTQKVLLFDNTDRRLSRITEGVTENGDLLYKKSKFAPTQPNHNLMRKFFEFGGEMVPITEDDKMAIKKQCNANSEFPSLILLGFKPAESIPFYHVLKHPYFVYPNESVCQGSAEAFAHLHASMLRRNVVGIGEFLFRPTAISYLVALLPLAEEFETEEDEDGGGDPVTRQLRPPGMRVVRIPFEDELRPVVADDATETFQSTGEDVAPEPLVEAAVKLVEKQQLNAELGYDFQNPAVEKYWDYVESIALEDGVKAGRKFDTEMSEEDILELAGDEIEKFSALLPEDIVAEKKRKAKILEVDDTGIDWETVDLSKCRVPELKKKLGAHGEKKSGNKTEVSRFNYVIVLASPCFPIILPSHKTLTFCC